MYAVHVWAWHAQLMPTYAVTTGSWAQFLPRLILLSKLQFVFCTLPVIFCGVYLHAAVLACSIVTGVT
jgi:hypothetical protein